jgi:phosphatidylglycerol---prolipoprotein diacylglyceryl transferase
MLTYPAIDPVAFELGPFKIHWYGISYVVGILLAWWLLRLRAARYHLTYQQVSDLIFFAALGMILGGRLGSVLFYNLPYYLQHPLEIIMINRGGMSFHGALIGVLVAIWYFGRKIDKGFFVVSDFLVPAVPVGLFFGRIANFINGELWGAPSTLPWAVVFPDLRAGGVPRHPSQLYEALLEGVLLFIILWCYTAKPRPAMAVSGLFLLGYGVFRSLVEFVREPDANIGYLAYDWVTLGQVLSFPMIVAGIILMFMAYGTGKSHIKG